MIPIILVSREDNKISNYLERLVAEKNISANYIYKIYPLKEEISINQVRQLKRDLILSQPKTRLIIFYDFDRSSLEAQNSLLKSLEEKTDHNLFVLITDNSEKILPTVRSRSKVIKLDKQDSLRSVDKDWKQLLETIKKSTTVDFLNHSKVNLITKEEAKFFFDQATIFFRDELLTRPNHSEKIIVILKKILNLSYLLDNNNLNPQLTVDNLLIFIWKSYRKI